MFDIIVFFIRKIKSALSLVKQDYF